MDIESLVKMITLEVLKYVNGKDLDNVGMPKDKKRILLLTEDNHPIEEDILQRWKAFFKVELIEDYSSHKTLSSYEAIVITSLSTKLMANIALGIRNGEIEAIIAEAIFQGKSIYLLEEAIIYKQYQSICNPKYYQMMEDYESRLYDFGIYNVNQNNLHERIACSNPPSYKNSSTCRMDKKIIVEADIEACLRKNITELCIPSKTIISPLAIDLIKQNSFTIVRKQ